MTNEELIKKIETQIKFEKKSESEYNIGRRDAYTNVLILFKQLEEPTIIASKIEPELPVIPQFVAEYIDSARRENATLLGAMDYFLNSKEIKSWMRVNQELFARAWLDGYTIEKETMYYVIFVESEDKEYGQALYKDFNFNGDRVVSTHIETFSKRISLEAGNFHFTEQEIKSIDERYWAFAEEVTE